MAHRSSGKKGFAAGAIFGGLVGGITALLLAPKSGNKTRKDLVNKYHDISDKTCDFYDDMCEQTAELVDKAKDIACSAKAAAHKVCRRSK